MRGRSGVHQGHHGIDGWRITDGYHGTDGTWHETSPQTRAALRRAMGGDPDAPGPGGSSPSWVVPAGWGEELQSPCHLILESGLDEGVVERLSPDLPIGRHQLIPIDGGPPTLLIIRPRRCHRPPTRAAGLAVQLYAARSESSWGIGDLRDLRSVGRWATAHGIDLVATSPLHAPSPAEHPQASPYYPSSRRWLNPLHISIDDVAGAAGSPAIREIGEKARALNADRRIDRAAVWSCKRAALERLFDELPPQILEEVERFRMKGGDDLERWATFCVVNEIHPGTWRGWPEELRHPDGPAVGRVAAAHTDRLRFHVWLQWLADQQLQDAAGASPLICDLAVGVDPGGADAWIDQDLLALDARVGAPPDDFAADGQDWGLPPYIPHALHASGYETFAQNVRANMRYGGGLRIDHVLGLFRLFWVPDGGRPAEGAYVRSHAEELLAVLAIESTRAGSFVVGEDLGTVEEGVRDDLREAGILGTRLVYFEDRPPRDWPTEVLGAVTTHDLPTVSGIWTGADATARAEAGLPAEDHSGSRAALERLAPEAATAEQVVAAAHRALARSPAEVIYGTIDDVLVLDERPNMPGTTDEWPNWSIALPVPLEALTAGAPPETLVALTERSPED